METLLGRRKDVSALDRRQVWHDPFTQAGMCKKRDGGWIFFRNPEGVAQFWRIGEKNSGGDGGKEEGEQS